ncbi:hypothetical protein PEC302107_25370 [Pectobacterium araliae]|nr:hypothetical protein PEC302107_25370 [Pectobacterium carotovorum subsp. carotovorum]
MLWGKQTCQSISLPKNFTVESFIVKKHGQRWFQGECKKNNSLHKLNPVIM